jgi:hypothetical protein
VASGLSGDLGAVTVTSGDGTASSYTARLQRQVPVFTDVVTPRGGCIRASAAVVVSATQRLETEIPCDELGDPGADRPVSATSTGP